MSCIHPDAIGRDGRAKTPSADAEGNVRLRDAGLGVIDDGTAYTLNTGAPPAVGPVTKVYSPHRTLQKDGSVREGFKEDDIHDALHKGAGNKTPYIVTGPELAERCAVDPQPDGRRYAACGDGVVAPVAEWIGRRLKDAIDGA